MIDTKQPLIDEVVLPLGDVVTTAVGETYCDNVRHVVARCAFLDEFGGDWVVPTIYQAWLEGLGLDEPARAMASQIRQVRERVGEDAWQESLSSGADPHANVPETVEADIQRSVCDMCAAIDAFGNRFQELVSDNNLLQGMILQVSYILQDLNLSWGWLMGHLVLGFWSEVWQEFVAEPLGDQVDWQMPQYWQPPDVVRGGSLPLDAEPKCPPLDGESPDEYLERMQRAFEEARRRIEAAAQPLGTKPSTREIEAIERGARWLYRVRVKGETIYGVAKEHYKEPGRHPDVITAIKNAEKWLALAPYTLLPLSESDM